MAARVSRMSRFLSTAVTPGRTHGSAGTTGGTRSVNGRLLSDLARGRMNGRYAPPATAVTCNRPKPHGIRPVTCATSPRLFASRSLEGEAHDAFSCSCHRDRHRTGHEHLRLRVDGGHRR